MAEREIEREAVLLDLFVDRAGATLIQVVDAAPVSVAEPVPALAPVVLVPLGGILVGAGRRQLRGPRKTPPGGTGDR